MKIDKELVKRIAFNARLTLTEQEMDEILPQLQEILKTFSQIKEADTTNTEPSFHSIEIKAFMRKDATGKCLTQTDALKNAGHKTEGYFKGPRAI